MNIIQKMFMKRVAKGFKPMLELMFIMMGDLCRAFYEKNGKEAIPTITQIARKNGAAQAEVMKKMMPAKDMKGVAEFMKMMDSMMDMGMEIVELSNDTIHVKMPKCMSNIEGTSRELCEAMMASDDVMMSTLLGKKVETKLLKTLAAGDQECEVIYSIKS